MNKMRNIVWCLVFLVTGLWGCYDDKGNYDYKELPGLEIDTTGLNISGEKIAYQFQTLLVDPKINYAGNKENLSYSWRLYPTNPVLDADKNKFDTIKPLATTPVFNEVIYNAPDSYYLTLTVEDKSVDVKYYWTCKIKVESELTSGLCVLDERDGEYDLNLIKSARLITNLNQEDEGALYNIFSQVNNGQKIEDGRFLGLSGSSVLNGVYVFAKNSNSYKLNFNTFESITEGFGDLFTFSLGITPDPACFARSTNGPTELFINDGLLYYVDHMAMGGAKTFGEVTGPVYDAAPFIAEVNTSTYTSVIFDKSQHRFLGAARSTVKEFLNLPSDAVWNINKVNKELVYLGSGMDNETYAVFNDEGTSNYYLYVANFTEASSDENPTPAKAVAIYDMNNCPGVTNSTLFTFGNLGKVCYYAAGDKLYQYNYTESANKANPIADFPAAGETITYLKVFKQNNHVQNGKTLIVGTWNGTEGKVYLVNFNEVSGTLDLKSTQSFGQFGKIVDALFK